jgi:hypothetical protein
MRASITHLVSLLVFLCFRATPAMADLIFSTGNPDGLMAMASRAPNSQIEAADDFIITRSTTITSATFTGLITGGVPLSNIGEVNIDLYHVFPTDSDTVRTPNVPTRVNSPADTEFDGRNSVAGDMSFVTSIIGAGFTTNNSVLNGINPIPNQTTGGEGPVTGEEVRFDVTFTTPFDLPPDHYFFVPTVQVTGGEFFWLSAPRPIVPPGTPFAPDLQAWIRNASLDPDWLRVGTDIVGGSPAPTFNASFSLTGQIVPEPASLTLFCVGMLSMFVCYRQRRMSIHAAK